MQKNLLTILDAYVKLNNYDIILEKDEHKLANICNQPMGDGTLWP